MKRLFAPLTAIFILLLSSGFLLAKLAGEEVRELRPFDGIGISIAADVFYTQGNTHEIRIEGNDKDVKDLVTEVKDGFLKVKYNSSKIKRSKLTIYITSQELEHVSISGSAKLRAEKPVSAEELDLSISGSGSVQFYNMKSEEIDVKISGSGDAVFDKGSAEEVDVKISGSGKLLAEQFEVSEFDAVISGSGTCKITVNDELEAKLSGSGSVYYHGDPRVNSVSSGSGKVRAL